MKKILLLIIAVLCFTNKSLNAQCSFTPTVEPGGVIFCPNGIDTLSTQVYDSYQWYKNNKPITGATSRQLIIHQQTDQGYLFKVAVSKNGCSDTSKKVLADGYAFSPPILVESGDLGVFDPKKDALVECPQDTVILTMAGPYTQNFQWYNNYKPIKGATHQTYYVTKTGSYTVTGSPAECPDYIACECLPLNTFYEIPVATITEKHDTLFASAAKKYQWFLGNKKIPGAVQFYYVPKIKGVYKVLTEDKYTCTALSDPFYFTHNNLDIITIAPNLVKDILHAHINTDNAKQVLIVDIYGNQKIKATIAGNDLNIPVQNIKAGMYVLQLLDISGQKITSATFIKQ